MNTKMVLRPLNASESEAGSVEVAVRPVPGGWRRFWWQFRQGLAAVEYLLARHHRLGGCPELDGEDLSRRLQRVREEKEAAGEAWVEFRE